MSIDSLWESHPYINSCSPHLVLSLVFILETDSVTCLLTRHICPTSTNGQNGHRPPLYPWYLAIVQWEFQDPKMEVPTIYKAYFSGLCKGISPENMALYDTVPPNDVNYTGKRPQTVWGRESKYIGCRADRGWTQTKATLMWFRCKPLVSFCKQHSDAEAIAATMLLRDP